MTDTTGIREVPWEKLREVPDHPEHRQVGVHCMDREQYTIEEWRIVGTFRTEHPHRIGCTEPSRTIAYWEPSLRGIRAYAEVLRRRKEERRSAYRNRVEADEEWTRHVESLIDGRDGE